jgi:hypothetical protein
MKRKSAFIDYMQRGYFYLRRAAEIWLFTHTRCPSRTVTEILVRERRDRKSSQPMASKTVGAAREANRKLD